LTTTLIKYLSRFKKLNTNRTHGIIAPHKPILLLSVLQAFANRLYNSPKIYITPELVALFKANWNVLVRSNHDCRISYPFYYLKSDKFWKLIPNAGFDNVNEMGSIMKSFSTLKAAVNHALIDEELFWLMKDDESNALLTALLLDEYFSLTKINFLNTTKEQFKIFDEIEGKILCEDPVAYGKEIRELIEEKNEEEIFLRGSMFKREIPKIYNNTCCISGMKIDATLNISMIDACHIVPFSESYNDTVSNGIALCPNLHRAFDRGLIGVNENCKVIISSAFKEDQTNYSIRIFEHQQLLLPKEKSFYPMAANFSWHRKNIFKE
jgi:putative restriction endonuclease